MGRTNRFGPRGARYKKEQEAVQQLHSSIAEHEATLQQLAEEREVRCGVLGRPRVTGVRAVGAQRARTREPRR
jgi:hypothetical protein